MMMIVNSDVKKVKKCHSLFASSLILALNPSFLAIDPSLVEKKLQGTEVYIGNSVNL